MRAVRMWLVGARSVRRPRTRRRSRALAITVRVLLSAIAIVAMQPARVARAHATILQISPADGTLLAAAPNELRVTFSEPISDEFIKVTFLTAGSSAEPLVGHLQEGDDRQLVVALPPLGDGLHRVAFSVRDREDLHEVRGRTSFSLGDHAVASPSPPPNPGPQPFETASRWLFAAGLATLAGCVATRSRAGTLLFTATVERRLVLLAGASLVAILLGRVGVLLARALDLHVGLGAGLEAVARTNDMVRLPITVGALACAVPLVATRRLAWLDAPVVTGRQLSIRAALAWVGVGWLGLLTGWGDHAALNGAVEPTVALAKAVHFVALATWLGLLVVTLLAHRGSGRTMAALAGASRTAVTAALLTVASGLMLAERMVVSLTGLFATTFGQLLLAKLAVAAFAVAVVVLPGTRRRIAQASVEAFLLLVVVVGLGAAMATAGPATADAYLAAPLRVAPQSVTADADDVIVRMRAVPAQPGTNALELAVVQTRRPAPAPITSVSIEADTISGSQRWEAQVDESGSVVIEDVDLAEGPTTFTVSVGRASLPTASATLTLGTQAAVYHHPPVLSSRRISVVLTVLAAVTALCVVPVQRGRRRTPGRPRSDAHVGRAGAHEVVEELTA
ncbi:MAG: copper resistance protein CopC [Actinomycetota bacterium]|nr:copper resistance protein CopC [Actinomycetota bacterium]